MPKTYHIVAPGKPRGKERPRFARGHAFTPKTTLDYEAYLRECAAGSIDEPMAGNEIKIIVNAYFRTKVHSDIDNIMKIAQDAFNKVAYFDDKQIKHAEGHIFFVESEDDVRLEITIIDG